MALKKGASIVKGKAIFCLFMIKNMVGGSAQAVQLTLIGVKSTRPVADRSQGDV